MKKFLIVFPVLLLVCAGMIMMSCTSDPTPPISNPDIVLKGGKFQYEFKTPKIEHGKEYEVIFTIEDCDESFVGSRLGGKICYKIDLNSDDEKVLSGWDYAVPQTVSKDVKEYKWTFKAGEANREDDEKITIENPATTPLNGNQYFSFTAQNGYENYNSSDNFNVKGKFEVVGIESVGDWISEGTLTLGNTDGTAGKGELSADDTAKIRAMPTGSKIEFTVNVANVNSSSGPGPGWGVGSVGGWNENNRVDINIPVGTPNGKQTFTVSIKISDIVKVLPSGNIAINVYSDKGATVTKAELFKPKT